MKTTKSREWFEKASKIIPGGVNSPVRALKHVGAEPVYFAKAEGARLYDVDGQEYVDFCMAFGPHIFGHSHPSIVEAVARQAGLGMTYGACHPLEVELVQALLGNYSFLDRGRLVNSGTEAVMTALRLARGFTGRPKILKFEGCYHGHSDGLLAKAGSGVKELSEASSQGVPASVVQDTLTARFDDLSTARALFERHGTEIAAVVLEPVPANDGLWVPTREHLQEVMQLARSHGALVLFDEVITGFRLSASGASGHFGLKPDLVTLGKIIGGGLPLAAVLGRGEILDCLAPQGPVYQAGTLSGNALACAAGLTVVRQLNAEPPYSHFESLGKKFTAELQTLLQTQGPAQVVRCGSIFWFHLGEPTGSFLPEITPDDKKRFGAFFRSALEQGVYFPPSPYEVSFLSTAHTPALLDEVLERVKRAIHARTPT